MNDPRTWNPKNPISHKITSTVAIVVSIDVKMLANNLHEPPHLHCTLPAGNSK